MSEEENKIRQTLIDPLVVRRMLKETGIEDISKSSIREIVKLVNQIEKTSGVEFIRMEIGEPGIPPPDIGINAEIEALKKGVVASYPDIEGVKILKEEASRFFKLFLDIDVSAEGCIPAVGSLMGSMLCFLVANRNDRTKEGTLFLDPGFPVHKQQVRMLGHDYYSFDVYNFRGKKLKEKLESYMAGGKISSILYSNPNNPSWICFTEEELQIIGELSDKYDVIVIEDLAYFGMDFRKDYSVPGKPPYQPTVAHYSMDYIILVSSSKIFSYAGQRIGIMGISDHLFSRRYPDLLRYYSSDSFGHALIYGALYSLSAGVTHSVQYGLAALLKAVNDGDYKYIDDVKEYGARAGIMKKLFLSNDFEIVYDRDVDGLIADGFYFTVSYQGMTSGKLLEELLCYGISAISLVITGSERTEGLRVCVSSVTPGQLSELGQRLVKFHTDHPVNN